ncbi:MAG TPA: DUF952 domain-containing protein [Caldilineaceae bacterium]|nr:DUF952 domain-containing protein [Caldilineaceae bacterium]
MMRVGSQAVFFQAHRGSVDEAPENTLAAFRHAWRFPGAIPETDVRTTVDGALVCLHDATLARTTDAPAAVRDRPVAELTLDEVRRWDAGGRFGPAFRGQPAPTLDELLAEMASVPDRWLYVEPKAVELAALRKKLDEYGVTARVILVSGYPAMLAALRRVFPGAPTMTWISGPPEAIREQLARWRRAGLDGLRQLQVHLTVETGPPEIRYSFDDDFLAATREWLAGEGVDLQLRPFALDAAALKRLLGLGVRWFVSDAPAHFSRVLAEARAGQPVESGAEAIYHITSASTWSAQREDALRPASLLEEGFIHCATRDQLLAVANGLFRGRDDLVVLRIDARQVAPMLRYESPADGLSDQAFPHVYAPISPSAVTAVAELRAGPSGGFDWPVGLP